MVQIIEFMKHAGSNRLTMLTKALDEAQRKVKNYFFDIRMQLFEYDEVLNSQRDRVYAERRRALVSDNLKSLIVEYAELTMDDILEVNNMKNVINTL
jgi:preprotein translocase subunit SecA